MLAPPPCPRPKTLGLDFRREKGRAWGRWRPHYRGISADKCRNLPWEAQRRWWWQRRAPTALAGPSSPAARWDPRDHTSRPQQPDCPPTQGCLSTATCMLGSLQHLGLCKHWVPKFLSQSLQPQPQRPLLVASASADILAWRLSLSNRRVPRTFCRGKKMKLKDKLILVKNIF